MMAHESHLGQTGLAELLNQFQKCREPDEAIALLKQLVPEFEHGRDNEEIEKAS
jgi:hypothetical protein